jgi:hypothetical protein
MDVLKYIINSWEIVLFFSIVHYYTAEVQILLIYLMHSVFLCPDTVCKLATGELEKAGFCALCYGRAILGGSPCHHSMALPWVADGRDGLQQWSLAANILNKQRWSSSLGVGCGANNSP